MDGNKRQRAASVSVEGAIQPKNSGLRVLNRTENQFCQRRLLTGGWGGERLMQGVKRRHGRYISQRLSADSVADAEHLGRLRFHASFHPNGRFHIKVRVRCSDSQIILIGVS